MKKFDLHMHTDRYSDCGTSSAEEMLEASVRAGLDGVVLTDHHSYWPHDELDYLREQFPSLIVLGGVEITTAQGDVLVYGPNDLPVLERDVPMMEVLAMTCSESYFRAVAHPFRYDTSEEHYRILCTMPFDGVEVASSHTTEEGGQIAHDLAKETDTVQIAASDAHRADVAGSYYTVFEDRIESIEDLVQALRLGRCRPLEMDSIMA